MKIRTISEKRFEKLLDDIKKSEQTLPLAIEDCAKYYKIMIDNYNKFDRDRERFDKYIKDDTKTDQEKLDIIVRENENIKDEKMKVFWDKVQNIIKDVKKNDSEKINIIDEMFEKASETHNRNLYKLKNVFNSIEECYEDINNLRIDIKIKRGNYYKKPILKRVFIFNNKYEEECRTTLQAIQEKHAEVYSALMILRAKYPLNKIERVEAAKGNSSVNIAIPKLLDEYREVFESPIGAKKYNKTRQNLPLDEYKERIVGFGNSDVTCMRVNEERLDKYLDSGAFSAQYLNRLYNLINRRQNQENNCEKTNDIFQIAPNQQPNKVKAYANNAIEYCASYGRHKLVEGKYVRDSVLNNQKYEKKESSKQKSDTSYGRHDSYRTQDGNVVYVRTNDVRFNNTIKRN